MAGNPLEATRRRRLWPRRLQWWASLWRHRPARDLRQVRAHYDVGEAFYRLCLDPRMVYSCAYFEQPTMSLAQAQEAKFDLICRKLQLVPGQRFLDVGMGWGALPLWAASRYGVDATGITLSRNQYLHAAQLVSDAGLSGKVRLKLLDYRELQARGDCGARFDRIASVGMFEHGGVHRKAHLPWR